MTILDNGNWGNIIKPGLMEEPIDTEEEFLLMTRVVRAVFATFTEEDAGIGRGRMSMKADDFYDLQIKTTTYDDLKNILKQINEIVILALKDATDTTYSEIRLTPGKVEHIPGTFVGILGIECLFTGKVRSTA